MRVLRWVIIALGKGFVYVLSTGWEAFNKLKPSVRLWTIALLAITAWLYFQSELWGRNRQLFYEEVFEPTGVAVYAVFKIIFVLVLVTIGCYVVYGFLRTKRPQNIEDIQTTTAVHEVIPLWRRLINLRKRQGGDE